MKAIMKKATSLYAALVPRRLSRLLRGIFPPNLVNRMRRFSPLALLPATGGFAVGAEPAEFETPYAGGSDGRLLAVDLDRDDATDIVKVTGDSLKVFRNRSFGHFEKQAAELVDLDAVVGLHAMDSNRDGRLEPAVILRSGELLFFRPSPGNPSQLEPVHGEIPNAPQPILRTWLLNNGRFLGIEAGDGTYTAIREVGSEYFDPHLGDDGTLVGGSSEFFAPHQPGAAPGAGGDVGGARFAAPQRIAGSHPNMRVIAAGDILGDGWDDLLFFDHDSGELGAFLQDRVESDVFLPHVMGAPVYGGMSGQAPVSGQIAGAYQLRDGAWRYVPEFSLVYEDGTVEGYQGDQSDGFSVHFSKQAYASGHPSGTPLSPPSVHPAAHYVIGGGNEIRRIRLDPGVSEGGFIAPDHPIRAAALNQRFRHPHDPPVNPDFALLTDDGLAFYEGNSDGFTPHFHGGGSDWFTPHFVPNG